MSYVLVVRVSGYILYTWYKGMELHVLRGAEKSIKQFLPIVYIESDLAGFDEAILKTLTSFHSSYVCMYHR